MDLALGQMARARRRDLAGEGEGEGEGGPRRSAAAARGRDPPGSRGAGPGQARGREGPRGGVAGRAQPGPAAFLRRRLEPSLAPAVGRSWGSRGKGRLGLSRARAVRHAEGSLSL